MSAHALAYADPKAEDPTGKITELKKYLLPLITIGYYIITDGY